MSYREPPTLRNIHITRLAVKVDGITEHQFIVILDKEGVGTVFAKVKAREGCYLRSMFVTQAHRHRGIGTKLLRSVEGWARSERADQLEISVHKGNAEARKWWINRKFIDAPERDTTALPDYRTMIKPL